MTPRIIYHVIDWLGWFCCELNFRTGCRGTVWLYRLGCWLGGVATDYGIRHGVLVTNPEWATDPEAPMYVEAPR